MEIAMPKFAYKAKRKLNDIVDGVIEAETQEVALNKLFKEGLFPVSIETLTANVSAAKADIKRKVPPEAAVKSSRKINFHQVLIFTQKLAILIRSKVELLLALKIIYEQTEQPDFRKVLSEIYNETKEGELFSDSLARFPDVFSSLYVNIVKAGEASGSLDASLSEINNFLTREEAMRTKIAVALAYPMILLVVGLGSIFVLINFVIPRLKPIFAGLGDQLPAITKIVLKVSEVSGYTWGIILGAVAGVYFLLNFSLNGKRFLKRAGISLKRNLPVIKKIIKNQELAHFSRSLSLLLQRGVPALKALKIVIPSMESPSLREGLKYVLEEVSAGKSLSQSFKNLRDLPDFFTKMVAVGEESGRLSEVLEEVSASYNNQVEADIAILSSLLEPLLILFLGLILGTIVLSILIPTFQVTQMVR